MNAPHDPRPKVGYRTTIRGRGISYAAPHAIAGLFDEAEKHSAPIDIDSIRFRLSLPDDPDHEDTVLRVTARVGAPPCPDCHQPGDRPHTDYCPTRCTCPPEQLIVGHMPRCPTRTADPWVLPAGGVCACGRDYDQAPTPACTTPTHHDHPNPIAHPAEAEPCNLNPAGYCTTHHTNHPSDHPRAGRGNHQHHVSEASPTLAHHTRCNATTIAALGWWHWCTTTPGDHHDATHRCGCGHTWPIATHPTP